MFLFLEALLEKGIGDEYRTQVGCIPWVCYLLTRYTAVAVLVDRLPRGAAEYAQTRQSCWIVVCVLRGGVAEEGDSGRIPYRMYRYRVVWVSHGVDIAWWYRCLTASTFSGIGIVHIDVVPTMHGVFFFILEPAAGTRYRHRTPGTRYRIPGDSIS